MSNGCGGAIVTFNYDQWLLRYPEFGGVDQPTAQAYFNEATIYCRNDGGSPVTDIFTQQTLLNMLTAHIAWLNSARTNGVPVTGGTTPASPLVGRVTNATEGSVSVAAQADYPPGSPQWFQQTTYGAAFYAASAAYRTMRYRVGPRRVFTPGPFGFVGGWQGW